MWRQVDTGVVPALYAATSPEAEGGAYYGPAGFGELTGGPAPARLPRAATAETARHLWEVSAELSGVHYDAVSHPGR
ncbi:hypothetical protein [Asanoa siamensis]|uniref:Short chain dehydrogenase n=1 Tax=Asanoa siamensis TaxID=926357 RepID=A0ABQ4CQE9_9ACTN|nr:hypothetical protein [Asanoa siamensis]GIF73490.1 hypothetical protein Asi02nite_30080 [Asanoa siamensis]